MQSNVDGVKDGVNSVKLECSKKSFYYHSCIVYNRNL